MYFRQSQPSAINRSGQLWAKKLSSTFMNSSYFGVSRQSAGKMASLWRTWKCKKVTTMMNTLKIHAEGLRSETLLGFESVVRFVCLSCAYDRSVLPVSCLQKLCTVYKVEDASLLYHHQKWWIISSFFPFCLLFSRTDSLFVGLHFTAGARVTKFNFIQHWSNFRTLLAKSEL